MIFPDIIMLFLRIIIVSLIQNAYRLPDIYLVVCDTYYGRVEYIYIYKEERVRELEMFLHYIRNKAHHKGVIVSGHGIY